MVNVSTKRAKIDSGSPTGYLCGNWCGSEFSNAQSCTETDTMRAFYDETHQGQSDRSCWKNEEHGDRNKCTGERGFFYKAEGDVDNCCKKHDECCGNGKLGKISGLKYAQCNDKLFQCTAKYPSNKCRTQDGVDNQLKNSHGGNTRSYSGSSMSTILFAGLGINHIAGGVAGFKLCCGATPGEGRCPVNAWWDAMKEGGKAIADWTEDQANAVGKGISNLADDFANTGTGRALGDAGNAIGGLFGRRRRRRRRKIFR